MAEEDLPTHEYSPFLPWKKSLDYVTVEGNLSGYKLKRFVKCGKRSQLSES